MEDEDVVADARDELEYCEEGCRYNMLADRRGGNGEIENGVRRIPPKWSNNPIL